MEEFKPLTSSDQILIDNQLTEEGRNDSSRNLPFHYAILNEVRSLGVSEVNDSSSLPWSGKNINTPPFHISRSIEYLKNYSNNLQSWVGHVVEIKDLTFVAELDDLTNPGTKETAEIEFSSVSPDDCSLVELGAVFYWSIGAKMNRGQISKESIIRFQRVSAWEENEYDSAADRASDLFKSINFE